MKEIKAVIQPQRLARLRDAFRKIPDFPGMSVTHAEGSGYHPGKPGPQNVRAELTDSSKRVRIEIVCHDHEVEKLVGLIREVCHTGRPGDGVVWLTTVETFIRIREVPPKHADQA